VKTPPDAPSLILFDLDDTIFDHSLTSRAALQEVQRIEPRLAVRPLDEVWRRYLERLNATDLTLGWVGHSAAFYEEARAARFRALAADLGWACPLTEARTISNFYRAEYQRLRRPVPGAVEFVRRMARSVPIGIVTNNQVSEQKEKLEFLGLTESVQHLIISEAVGFEKPSPEIYHAALASAHVRPREAVMVGDSWPNDVLGARAVGIRPVWFNRFGRPRPTRHHVDEIGSFRPPSPADRVVRGRSSAGRGPRR
jgi:HAD superfamily hydrolase (TIGR01549 family)